MFPSSTPANDIQLLTRSIASGERALRLLQPLPPTEQRRIKMRRIESNLAFQQLQLALARYEMVRRKFNPAQLRVPAGHPDGGQWTDEGGAAGSFVSAGGRSGRIGSDRSARDTMRDEAGEQPWKAVETIRRADGSLSRQTVVNRDDKTAIHSEFSAPTDSTDWDERHTVQMPDGTFTTFQTSGLSQTVFDTNHNVISSTVWTDNGLEPEATVQLALYVPPVPLLNPVGAAITVIAGAVALYNMMSSRNSANETAVFAFRSDAYVPGAKAQNNAIWVGSLTKDKVDKACPRHTEVQSITDEAVGSVSRDMYTSAAQYGTAVHKWIERSVNGPDPEYPKDPDFRAEVSLTKSNYTTYGSENSKRVDVLENPGNGTVCVYDIKTGKSGLSPARAVELASTVQHYWPGTQQIIVTEVRPH
ncbi:hypothetical protein ABLE91_27315 [Aquabacter sp. CN5-332]|uniref:hypothetical protein n=1 Tax=Aquabacter sp. CN5-332 TaxID=3156608 RepID=UPI0032B5F0B4